MKKINGDNINGFLKRIIYFIQCISDHGKGSNHSCDIYNPTLSISNIDTFGKTPSRILCDYFWNSINFENLKIQLNSNFNIVDIGCGSGVYGKFLKKITGKFFDNYTGLDIYKHHDFPLEFKHIKAKAESIYNYIDKKTNFVISQSSLEHIEEDKYVLEKTTKKLIENKIPFIQIHMVPASLCLWLYLWHGYRQYSKKNLSNISNELKKNFDVNTFIVPIGGKLSFWTHFKYVTLPIYIKKILMNDQLYKWYSKKNIQKKIIKNISKELECKHQSPIFWALVITPNNINIMKKLIKNHSPK